MSKLLQCLSEEGLKRLFGRVPRRKGENENYAALGVILADVHLCIFEGMIVLPTLIPI